jgi:hypothetical protein
VREKEQNAVTDMIMEVLPEIEHRRKFRTEPDYYRAEVERSMRKLPLIKGLHAIDGELERRMMQPLIRRHVFGIISTDELLDTFTKIEEAMGRKLSAGVKTDCGYGCGLLGKVLANKWNPMGSDLGECDPFNMKAFLGHHRGVGKLIEFMLARGADINGSMNDGRSPLMLAIERGFEIDAIKVLLDYGADLLRTDRDGRSALDYAKDSERPELVALIAEATLNAERTMQEEMARSYDQDNPGPFEMHRDAEIESQNAHSEYLRRR